jgi:hypothetical protein
MESLLDSSFSRLEKIYKITLDLVLMGFGRSSELVLCQLWTDRRTSLSYLYLFLEAT